MGRGVMQGVAGYAQARDDWTFMTLTRADRVLGYDASSRSFDAVIGVVTPELAAGWEGECRRFVVNTSRARVVPGATNICVDDAAIGRMAASYFSEKGLNHFAFYGHVEGGRRAEAFVEALTRPGRPVARIETSASNPALGRQLRELAQPCGILAFNDIEAIGLIRAARKAGIEIPADLAVVGVDNDLFISMFSPIPITSVVVDFERIGYEAARRLDRVFEGEAPPGEPILVPPIQVVERQSTDFPGQIDPLAVKAARAIRQRACEPIRVPEMINRVPASYRTVDRRFRKAFGRSLHEEVTQVRIAEAARLLRMTRLPLWAIAQQVGYGNTNYFNTVFRKQMGQPPGTYRRIIAEPEG